jgi:hypothetical protein
MRYPIHCACAAGILAPQTGQRQPVSLMNPLSTETQDDHEPRRLGHAHTRYAGAMAASNSRLAFERRHLVARGRKSRFSKIVIYITEIEIYE